MTVSGEDYVYDEGLPIVSGSISGVGLPFDLDDEEAERRYQELLELEKRRRPAGFAPWPEQEEPPAAHLRIA